MFGRWRHDVPALTPNIHAWLKLHPVVDREFWQRKIEVNAALGTNLYRVNRQTTRPDVVCGLCRVAVQHKEARCLAGHKSDIRVGLFTPPIANADFRGRYPLELCPRGLKTPVLEDVWKQLSIGRFVLWFEGNNGPTALHIVQRFMKQVVHC